MGLLLVTPPATEPVTLAEAKAQCRVDSDLPADDALITALAVAAREVAEQQCERSFITTAWRLYLDYFPCTIRLPRPNVIAVQSIQYLDTANVLQTLDPAEYQVSASGEITRIQAAYQRWWPYTIYGVMEAVRVNFTAGYGAASAVPQAIKQAILLTVEHWYENRGEDASMRDMPVAAENLLRRYWPGNYS